MDRPLRTITTLDRFGLVTWVDRIPMLRMLQVDELMTAMGFQGGYSLDGIGQRRDRIRLLGNGVAPPVMKAVVEALTGVTTTRRVARDALDVEPIRRARTRKGSLLQVAAE